MYNKLLVRPKVGGDNIEKSHEMIRAMRAMLEEFYSEYDLKIITSAADIDEHTIAVPVGGDGTVLSVAKNLITCGYDIPVMGFNLGQLGFLTDLKTDSMFIGAFFDSILDLKHSRYYLGPFKEDSRTLLKVECDGVEYVALNDFVISNLYSDNIIKYDLEIGESFAGQHKANGVIIATPTGSTAYAMNVGGAIIEPDLDVIEVIPIAGLGMTTRPIITSGKNRISISVHGGPGRTISFKADGQECQRFENKDITISITQHPRKIRLLHFADWNFFEKMTDKLGWNA